MKQGLTEIIFVIDKSGSMGTKKEDAIGGFNQCLEDQRKEDGDAIVTMTLFDTAHDLIHDGVPINDVPRLTLDTYRPGGNTALLDAMGLTIDKVGERLHNTPEDDRPEHVIMVIITDGQENASTEYEKAQIADKVRVQQDDYKWTFLFLGADMDAINDAHALGITRSIVGTRTGAEIKQSFATMSQAVCCVRKGKPVDGSWSSTSGTSKPN
jgi:uncharacterized protein YegL